MIPSVANRSPTSPRESDRPGATYPRISDLARFVGFGLGALAAVLGLAALLAEALGAVPGMLVLAGSATGFLIVAGVVRIGRGRIDRFGAANGVTLVRAGFTCLLTGVAVALVAAPLFQAPLELVSVCRLAVLLGLVAAMLDGLDGWIARRFGQVTPFGARFDMEVDAATMLVLSLLVWLTGVATVGGPAAAGAWVLMIGLLRYGFVAAGLVLPALRGPVPEASRHAWRRKSVCALQQVVLIAALLPELHGMPAATLLAIALAVLIWSFGIDSRHLLCQRPGRRTARRHSVVEETGD